MQKSAQAMNMWEMAPARRFGQKPVKYSLVISQTFTVQSVHAMFVFINTRTFFSTHPTGRGVPVVAFHLAISHAHTYKLDGVCARVAMPNTGHKWNVCIVSWYWTGWRRDFFFYAPKTDAGLHKEKRVSKTHPYEYVSHNIIQITYIYICVAWCGAARKGETRKFDSAKIAYVLTEQLEYLYFLNRSKFTATCAK